MMHRLNVSSAVMSNATRFVRASTDLLSNVVAHTINNLTHLQRGVPGPDVMTTCADQPNRCRNGDNSAQGAAATRGDLNRRSMLGCLQRLQQLSPVVFLLLALDVVHVATDTPTPETDTTLEPFAGSLIILCDDNLRGFICNPGGELERSNWESAFCGRLILYEDLEERWVC